MPQVTMQAVARAAGLSRSTVSLALRKSARIPAATTARVLAVAEKLGYQKNPLVTALMTELRTGRRRRAQPTLAFVTGLASANAWRSDPGQLELYQGLCDHAHQMGFRVQDYWLFERGQTALQLSRMLRARGIRGLFIARMRSGFSFPELNWDDFAAVAAGYSLSVPGIHRVANDQYATIRRALAELTLLGYRRIGFVLTHFQDVSTDHHWRAGLRVYQDFVPPRQRVPLLLLQSADDDAAIAAWYERHRPDCVLSVGTMMFGWLKKRGIDMPGTTGFASLDVPGRSTGMAGMFQNHRLEGCQGGELLTELVSRGITGPSTTPRTWLIESEWVPGDSVCRKTSTPA